MGTPAQDLGFEDVLDDDGFTRVEPDPDLEQLSLDVLPESQAVPPVKQQAPQPTEPSTFDDFKTGLRNPFGLSDETAEIMTRFLQANDVETPKFPRQIGRGMNQPLDPRDMGQIAHDQELATQKAAQKRSPWGAGAGRAISETAITAPAMVVAPAVTALGRLAQAAKLGFGTGTATGFGESEAETPLELAKDTAVGGVVGGVAAPVAGEFMHQAVRGAQPLVQGVKNKAQQIMTERGARQVQQQNGDDLAAFARGIANPSETQAATRAQMMAGESPEALAQHAGALEKNVTQISRAGDEIQAAETIGKKARHALQQMEADGIDTAPAIQETDQLIEEMSQEVAGWKKKMVKGAKDHSFLTRVQVPLAQYKQTVAELADTPNQYVKASQRFALADQAKREFQGALASMDRSSPSIEAMHASEQRLRSLLESPDLWGPTTGAMQQERNKAWTSYLALNTKDVAPGRTFLTDVYGEPSKRNMAYRPLQTGDEPALQEIARKAGTLEGKPEEWKLREYATRAADLGQALTTNPQAPNLALTALAQSQRTAAGNVAQTLDQRIAEKKASDMLGLVAGTPPKAPGMIEQAVKAVPSGMTAGAGLAGIGMGQQGLGAGALALGGAAQGGKQFFEGSAPAALAQRAQEIARLEAQAATNPLAKSQLDRMRGVPMPSSRLQQGAELVARQQAGTLAPQAAFTGRQLGDALQEWQAKAPKQEAKQISSESRGHDLGNTIEFAIERNPEKLGPYADKFRGKSSQQISQILYQLSADPEWTKKYLPQFQSLTQQ